MSQLVRFDRLIVLALVVLICFDGVQLVLSHEWWLRLMSLLVVVLVTAQLGYRFGCSHTASRFVEATRWLPRDITWHEDDNGHTHALVTQVDGTVHTIELPDDIDNADDALGFVLAELSHSADMGSNMGDE